MPSSKQENDKAGAPPGDGPTSAADSPSRRAKTAPSREDRLADALRANLRRRKAGGKEKDEAG